MNNTKLATLGAILMLAGCANLNLFPPFQKPAVETPAAWPGLPANAKAYDNAQWWKVYGDVTLNQLVEEALSHNEDIVIASARIDEARAQLTLADAETDPTLTATFTPSYSRSTQRGTNPLPPSFRARSRDYMARINASYEIDLWGKLRGATAAARANLLATEAARDTVRNSLTAQVAQGYFALLALDAQIETTRRTQETRQAALKLQQLRMQSGVSSEFEVRQVEADLATVQAQTPALERNRTQQQNALAILLGRSPREVVQGKVVRGSPAAPAEPVVPAGLPSELLLRRPDLREAEQRLIAANANIGVARAAYYPSITLTGYFGGESNSLADLFVGPARIFRFAGELLQPIFNGKRIGASVDVAKASEQQVLAQYRQAIASAFRDVQDALAAQQSAREVLVAEHAHVDALQKGLTLAKLRYENGISSQLDLLDAERNLLQAQLNLTEAERAQRAAVADLFKAMGGGWNSEQEAKSS
ncbi:MAG TPA: efflux transporter outer membrane subunit [Novimethylophilus sp.]|jgi:multidrug efflux system outer membrane protein|uniref:efflux transporter outer membrane subunit n=1 Tax=Novimethylophilus sp. TaxID=2137426 RepID=UPI002F3F8A62